MFAVVLNVAENRFCSWTGSSDSITVSPQRFWSIWCWMSALSWGLVSWWRRGPQPLSLRGGHVCCQPPLNATIVIVPAADRRPPWPGPWSTSGKILSPFCELVSEFGPNWAVDSSQAGGGAEDWRGALQWVRLQRGSADGAGRTQLCHGGDPGQPEPVSGPKQLH